MIRAWGQRTSSLLQAYYFAPDHPFKIRLWRWFRRATGYPRLTVRYGPSAWISIDERDWLQGILWAGRYYEPEVWAALAKFAEGEEVLWDIGAHIGCVTIRAMLDHRIAEIHAFEPEPLTAGILRLNVRLNARRGRCQVHELALSSAAETRLLYQGPAANTGLTSLAASGTAVGASVRVQCRTIDQLVADGTPPPTLMKVDVEDWERHVIAGGHRLMTLTPPKALVIEAVPTRQRTIADQELLRSLECYGYVVQHIARPDGVIQPRENFLAVYIRRRLA
jgi:FkbM family methyltransferase